ncbi:DUF3892 domain-containing protein [Curtobacterium flaccumfaciens pv. flaccumfaciens]|uniref:DUF3892 domain-containing protein n=1 Tax=Curtobacterium flaccumfaciens TaxID=2035 RepID=UPI00217F00A0|nr:DUF3892 domain-containing protein [Curtobacterium flaccumfaciens]MCS6586957.1 DUF3892 domain-containing protein [Curtobacterium flaccumfaciens pv. flaccumfaciens]
MSIRVTHIRLSGSVRDHEHITDVRWISLEDGDTGTSSVATVVAWIEDKNGKAYVGSGANKVSVGVVRPQGRSPYLRTYADRQWNNNLLSLDTF